MKRTQLYLEDDVWGVLHAQAREHGTTISQLVREALRDRYLGSLKERKRAMLAVVGLWKDRGDIGDSTEYVRQVRRGDRLRRVAGE
jgi:hypothetical protein